MRRFSDASRRAGWPVPRVPLPRRARARRWLRPGDRPGRASTAEGARRRSSPASSGAVLALAWPGCAAPRATVSRGDLWRRLGRPSTWCTCSSVPKAWPAPSLEARLELRRGAWLEQTSEFEATGLRRRPCTLAPTAAACGCTGHRCSRSEAPHPVRRGQGARVRIRPRKKERRSGHRFFPTFTTRVMASNHALHGLRLAFVLPALCAGCAGTDFGSGIGTQVRPGMNGTRSAPAVGPPGHGAQAAGGDLDLGLRRPGPGQGARGVRSASAATAGSSTARAFPARASSRQRPRRQADPALAAGAGPHLHYDRVPQGWAGAERSRCLRSARRLREQCRRCNWRSRLARTALAARPLPTDEADGAFDVGLSHTCRIAGRRAACRS